VAGHGLIRHIGLWIFKHSEFLTTIGAVMWITAIALMFSDMGPAPTGFRSCFVSGSRCFSSESLVLLLLVLSGSPRKELVKDWLKHEDAESDQNVCQTLGV